MGKHKAIRRFLGIFLAVVMVFTLWTPIPVAASTKKSHAEYSGRFYTPIPEIGNRRSDVKETALPF